MHFRNNIKFVGASKTRDDYLVVVLLFACFALWGLFNPYAGIVGDGQLYCMQALAHLFPDSLGGDISLQNSSQDKFTLFQNIYSPLISFLGMHWASVLLTGVGAFTFLFAVMQLAYLLVGRHFIFPALLLIALLPGNYGADGTFSLLEPFVTPRLLAQSLTLVGICCWLKNKRMHSSIMLMGAFLIHPLMAMAGGVILFCLCVFNYLRGKGRAAWGVGAGFFIFLCVIFIILSILLPEQLFFDRDWLGVVEGRTPYLFLSKWHADDWSASLVPIIVLFLIRFELKKDPATSQITLDVIIATLITGLLGLIVSGLGTDVLSWVLPTQGQAWRWVWVSIVVAACLLPKIVQILWARGGVDSAIALLLVATWVARQESFGWQIAVVALLLRQLTPSSVNQSNLHKYIFAGAGATLVLSLMYLWIPPWSSYVGQIIGGTDHWFSLFGYALKSSHGLVPLALIACSVGLLRYRNRMPASILLLIGFCGIVGLIRWGVTYPVMAQVQEENAQIHEWRRSIPKNEEVFWYDAPEASWFLLRRASYFSKLQSVAALFSRKTALELMRRAHEVQKIMPNSSPMVWGGINSSELKTKSLKDICDVIRSKYIVVQDVLNEKPINALSGISGLPYVSINLYRCSGI